MPKPQREPKNILEIGYGLQPVPLRLLKNGVRFGPHDTYVGIDDPSYLLRVAEERIKEASGEEDRKSGWKRRMSRVSMQSASARLLSKQGLGEIFIETSRFRS